MSPERRHTLCASLRSRNALQHVTRATPYGNLMKFTGKMPQTRVSTQIRHRPLHLPEEPLSVDKLFGESRDRLQLPASVSLLDCTKSV